MAQYGTLYRFQPNCGSLQAGNLKHSLFIALLYLQQYRDTIGFKIGKPFINR